jgi:hypothetical protein
MRTIFLAVIALSRLSLDAQTITVYVKDRAPVGPVDLSRAMAKAAELLCPAGVQIRWHRGEPNSQNPDFGRLILVQIVSGVPDGKRPETLAFAQAYEGVHLTILYDRVSQIMPESPQIVLGYVLAHEITHLLEGISRHSDTGIMKAGWNRADIFAMRRGRLVLSSEDLDLIHRGIERRELALLASAR